MKRCGCIWSTKDLGMKVECEMHEPGWPWAKWLNTSQHWIQEGETQVRVVGGYMDGLLHGLYQEMRDLTS